MIGRRQRNVALLVASCFFMENLDGTIVTTAAKKIGEALHVASTEVGFVVTAYLITLAILIPLSGWMVARFGARKVFLTAIVTFTTASFLCSTSVNIGELIGMRVLQGFGGAMMVPVGRLAVLAKLEKTDIMRAVAYIVWPGLVAPVIAPLAGGLITTYASWRWLFLINVPLGVIALLLAIRLMPGTEPSSPPRLDVTGVALTCVALGGITFVAHLLSETSIAVGTTVAVVVVALGALGLSVRHLLRAENPLVDLRTLRVPSFRMSLSGGALFAMTVGSVPFLLPLLFENVFGWSAIKSGSLVLWVFVGNIGIKPTTSFLLNRFGFRRVLLASTAGAAGTIAVLGLFTARTPLPLIAVLAMASGVARSVGFTCYNTLCFGDIPQSDMRHANTLFATQQQLSVGFGIAAATVALRLGEPIGQLVTASPNEATIYTIAFFLVSLFALGATGFALGLRSDAGDALRTIRPKRARARGAAASEKATEGTTAG